MAARRGAAVLLCVHAGRIRGRVFRGKAALPAHRCGRGALGGQLHAFPTGAVRLSAESTSPAPMCRKGSLPRKGQPTNAPGMDTKNSCTPARSHVQRFCPADAATPPSKLACVFHHPAAFPSASSTAVDLLPPEVAPEGIFCGGTADIRGGRCRPKRPKPNLKRKEQRNEIQEFSPPGGESAADFGVLWQYQQVALVGRRQ